jgi:5-formyltetrahydrofolate cyclo-ligase
MLPTLRRNLRRQRTQLSEQQQALASQAVVTRLTTLPLFHVSLHVALYCPLHGEIDLTPLLEKATHHHYYFPVMREERGLMDFYPVRNRSELIPNHIGIGEPTPDRSPPIEPTALDLVLLPLVAFDRSGHRLGTGGGYYDRYFAFRRERSPSSHPFLLGVAYDFQRQSALPFNPTDVPLDAVITESGFTRFSVEEKDE